MTNRDIAFLRTYVHRGDEPALLERLDCPRVVELLDHLDEAIRLAHKAMTGGNITRADTDKLGELCKLVGHKQ